MKEKEKNSVSKDKASKMENAKNKVSSTISSTKEKGKVGLFHVVFGRTFIIALLLCIQIIFLFGISYWLKEYTGYIYGLSSILAVFIMINIMNKKENPSYVLTWVIPILILPVFGVLLYIFVKSHIGSRVIQKRHKMAMEKTKKYLELDPVLVEKLEEEEPSIASLAKYMSAYGGYPMVKNTEVKYFSCGEEKFASLIEELEKAESFIFLEYFIISKGYMWDTILEILKRKAKQGVDVRVMYDGMCSLVLLPYSYPEQLEKFGIKCKIFSPPKPALSSYQNNRDHRKILVIDGKVAYTGGINIGDEYINAIERFGYWKDTAVLLKGDAVHNFTFMFLQMWDVVTTKYEINYEHYMKKTENHPNQDLGYVMGYSDSPLDNENVGEEVYLHILNHAKKYVHIMTPYLILDYEMERALEFTAKRGIEVILILPHIPDKKYAFWLAKTYYKNLIDAGVQIYEFRPGFVHAKVFTSDNEKAVVGTINLDYRSLYLHFECAAFMYKNPVILDIEKDFQQTLEQSIHITKESLKQISPIIKFIGKVLRLFAPLM